MSTYFEFGEGLGFAFKFLREQFTDLKEGPCTCKRLVLWNACPCCLATDL